MTEADVQPSASIASTGPGIRYIGDRCYAYSGVITAAGSAVPMLSFTSGAGIIVATVQFFYQIAGATDVKYSVKFNDIPIMEYTCDSSAAGNNASEPDNTAPIIIPPFTKVLTTCLGGNDHYCILVGRVYGAD